MVFSTTTMASSTTIPMARTSPNRVRLLIDIPNSFMAKKVPISETGMVADGMTVVRQSCRKMNTEKITSRIAMIRVEITSSIEASMYSGGVVGDDRLEPLREALLQLGHGVLHALGHARAFEPGSWYTAIATLGAPPS